MKNLEEFKKNHLGHIAKVADRKTEWLKDFVESQKPKPKPKTVGEMINENKPIILISTDCFEEYRKRKISRIDFK